MFTASQKEAARPSFSRRRLTNAAETTDRSRASKISRPDCVVMPVSCQIQRMRPGHSKSALKIGMNPAYYAKMRSHHRCPTPSGKIKIKNGKSYEQRTAVRRVRNNQV